MLQGSFSIAAQANSKTLTSLIQKCLSVAILY